MNKRRPVLAVSLVFLLGILCGSLATHLLYRCRFESIFHGREESREEMVVNRLNSTLDLNGRQLEQVRAIVHETHEGIMEVRQKLRPQMESLVEQAQGRIEVLLTPEQRVKFEKMIAERKQRHKEKGFH